MPPSGPGSIARFGPRLVGVVIDWAIATVIAAGVFQTPLPFSSPTPQGGNSFAVLGVFAVLNLVLVSTLGYTIGHRVAGLQVRSLGGTGRVLPVQALVRTLLLCLFIPAMIWDRDGRGVHDRVPNTVIARTR